MRTLNRSLLVSAVLAASEACGQNPAQPSASGAPTGRRAGDPTFEGNYVMPFQMRIAVQ